MGTGDTNGIFLIYFRRFMGKRLSRELIVSVQLQEIPLQDEVWKNLIPLIKLSDAFYALVPFLQTMFFIDCSSDVEVDEDSADDVRFIENGDGFASSIIISSALFSNQRAVEWTQRIIRDELAPFRKDLQLPTNIIFELD